MTGETASFDAAIRSAVAGASVLSIIVVPNLAVADDFVEHIKSFVPLLAPVELRNVSPSVWLSTFRPSGALKGLVALIRMDESDDDFRARWCEIGLRRDEQIEAIRSHHPASRCIYAVTATRANEAFSAAPDLLSVATTTTVALDGPVLNPAEPLYRSAAKVVADLEQQYGKTTAALFEGIRRRQELDVPQSDVDRWTAAAALLPEAAG